MTGPSLAYQVVDVFTSTPFAGNPLAVVLDGDDLSTAQMQTIAREFNLSETTFPMKPSAGATYGLRIFTPTTELPFAGHPSVGSAWVLRQLGRIESGDNVQACGVGLISVHVGDTIMLMGGPPTLSEPVDPAPLLAALGLGVDDLAGPPPRWAGVGAEFAYLLVRPEALGRAVLDFPRAAAFGHTGLSLLSWDGSVARCRCFPCGVGIPEEPATGSAALALGVFLAASGVIEDGTHDYVVEQGYELKRPSTLSCRVTVVAGRAVSTSVNGSVVRVASGEISVPLR